MHKNDLEATVDGSNLVISELIPKIPILHKKSSQIQEKVVFDILSVPVHLFPKAA
jgi:hypothetical protein